MVYIYINNKKIKFLRTNGYLNMNTDKKEFFEKFYKVDNLIDDLTEEDINKLEILLDRVEGREDLMDKATICLYRKIYSIYLDTEVSCLCSGACEKI